MLDLKPCPFCGCSVHLYKRKYPNGETAIGISGMHAEDCIMERCFPNFDNMEEAAEAWNMRAEEDY